MARRTDSEMADLFPSCRFTKMHSWEPSLPPPSRMAATGLTRDLLRTEVPRCREVWPWAHSTTWLPGAAQGADKPAWPFHVQGTRLSFYLNLSSPR